MNWLRNIFKPFYEWEWIRMRQSHWTVYLDTETFSVERALWINIILFGKTIYKYPIEIIDKSDLKDL